MEGRSDLRIVLLVFSSALGGFLFGYDTGVVSGVQIALGPLFDLSHREIEAFVSVTVATAAVAAAAGGYISNVIGRKETVVASSTCFLIGSILLTSSYSFTTLLIGRVFHGAGVGLSALVVPQYLAEIAPTRWRGFMVTCNTIFVTGGQVIANVICYFFSERKWRVAVGLAIVPAALQLFLFCFFLPQSPRWLHMKGRMAEMESVLERYRNSPEEVEQEIRSINSEDLKPIPVSKIFCDPTLRAIFLLGMVLQFTQQIVGINTIMYYSVVILKLSGFVENSQALFYNIIVTSFNFLGTFLGLFLVEKVGRRKLTLGSLLATVTSLFLIFLYFFSIRHEEYPIATGIATESVCSRQFLCDSCLRLSECQVQRTNASLLQCVPSSLPSDLALDMCPSRYGALIIVILCLYLVSYASGLGSMPWTINSEIYPTECRGKGMAAATSVNFVTNFVISFTFLTATNSLGKDVTFLLYCVLSLLCFFFLYAYLVETKNIPLEEVIFQFRERTHLKEPLTM